MVIAAQVLSSPLVKTLLFHRRMSNGNNTGCPPEATHGRHPCDSLPCCTRRESVPCTKLNNHIICSFYQPFIDSKCT
ncbi:hypothetical protein V8C44DRAFT_325826 [Trichoderma aethiopicum]